MISWAHDHGLQLLLNHSINWFCLNTVKVSLVSGFVKLLYCLKLVFFVCFLLKSSQTCFLLLRKCCLYVENQPIQQKRAMDPSLT